ncbi:MAG: tetratricopeptide repeat protein [Pseudomonadota bacterium]
MQNTEFHFSDYVFRPETNLLILNSRSEILEQRVSDLLLIFCQSDNEKLSKLEVIEAVWPDRVVNEDSLSVAISKLRKVLGDSRHNPTFIKTLSGHGYQWLPRVEVKQATQEKLQPLNQLPTNPPVEHKPKKPAIYGALIAIVAVIVGASSFYLLKRVPEANSETAYPKAVIEQHNKANSSLEVMEPEHQRKAISIARDIIQQTPGYLPAYLTVAQAKIHLSMLNSYRDIGIYKGEVQSIVDFVLEKEPENGHAWLLQAWLKHIANWEFESAKAAYLNALKYSPEDPLVYQGYSEFLISIGDFENAEKFLGKLRRKNPDYYKFLNMSYVYLFKEQYDLAAAEVQRIENSEAESRLSQRVLNRIAILTGNDEEAFRTLKQLMKEQHFPEKQIAHYESIFNNHGLSPVYQELLDRRVDTNLGHYLPPLSWARYAVVAGDFDQAIHWLNRAIETKQPAAIFIPIDPHYQPLNNDSKFDSLKSRVKNYIQN